MSFNMICFGDCIDLLHFNRSASGEAERIIYGGRRVYDGLRIHAASTRMPHICGGDHNRSALAEAERKCCRKERFVLIQVFQYDLLR